MRSLLGNSSSRLSLALGASLFAASFTGCAPIPAVQPRPLLMGAPVITGLGQVRDQRTGGFYFVPCNPCAAPMAKTPVLATDVPAPVVTPANRTRTPVAPLEVATLARAADDAIPAGTVAVADLPPVIVAVAATSPVARLVAAPTASPSHAKHSIQFSSSVFSLGHGAQNDVAHLLPLVMQAERVYIRGRTDATGTAQGNRTLATARAAAVRAALIAGGVDARKLKQSFCTTCFIAPNDTEDGRSANRRVEVELVMPALAVATSQ